MNSIEFVATGFFLLLVYGTIYLSLHQLVKDACGDAIKEKFSISSQQREQVLMILSDYEDNSFGLEAGSLARQIKEIIDVK